MKSYKYVIMILLLLLNVAVEATVVTLETGEQAQTEDGQEFSFNSSLDEFFMNNEVPLSNGDNGTLIIRARGDYILDNVDFENLIIEIDGKTFGPYGAPGSELKKSYDPFDDNEWMMDSIVVSGALLEDWTIDGEIVMVVTLSDGVNIDLPAHDHKPGYVFEPYIDVTLVYSPVPIPLSIWLFATGIFSLFGVRRLTAKSA